MQILKKMQYVIMIDFVANKLETLIVLFAFNYNNNRKFIWLDNFHASKSLY